MSAAWLLAGLVTAAGCTSASPIVDEPQKNESASVGSESAEIQGENLSGSNLAGTNLSGTNLAGSNLAGANLGGNNLAGNNLAGSNLAGTNLAGNNLAGSNLAGSNLAGSNLAGSNLAGSNLSGTNLSGSNLSGSNLSGTNLAGNNLSGTNLSGTNLAGSNSGANIHGLTGTVNGMLYSGEDLWKSDGTNRGQCVVMGIGSTAFPKLLGQQSANAKISVALGKLPWGFASTSGGSVALSAWEAVVWGDTTYCTFVMVSPTTTNWLGVAGFIKAIFRWNAPPTQSIDISGIEASAPYDSTLQTSIYTYPGMMNAGAQWRAGNIPDKNFIIGELGFASATTNNQSVLVDFSSWVTDKNGNALVLGNVSSSPVPTYAESKYMAMDMGSGLGGIAITDAAEFANGTMPAGITNSTHDLDYAYQNWKFGYGPKPTPLRCGGALYLNVAYNEPVPAGKCDTGLAWPAAGGCGDGSQAWSTVSGTTAPMNQYMQLTKAGNQYERAVDGTCNLHQVISETYVHMFSPSYSMPSSYTVDDGANGRNSSLSNAFNYAGSWVSYLASSSYYNADYSESSTANDAATFTFYGTQAKLYVGKGTRMGKVAVSMDGGTETTVDLYASGSETGNNLIFTSATLAQGVHTLKARVTGAKNSSSSGTYVDIDRVDVINNTSCTAETDSAFCTRLGDNCGSVSANDNCGTPRTVTSCGTCTSPQTCGGGGTANVCGGGTSAYLSGATITASISGTSPEDKTQAFDNSTSTKWYAGGGGGTSTNTWITAQFSTAKTVTSYKIGSGNDAADRDPKSWKLEGSNDGTNWTLLSQPAARTCDSNGPWARSTLTSAYNISNSTAYTRYRWTSTATCGSPDFQVSEIQLFGY